MSEYPLYDINKMGDEINLNVLFMILFKWDMFYVIILFI